MKNTGCMKRSRPPKAAAWQDFVCEMSWLLSSLLGVVIPILIVVVILQRHIVQGFTMSGLK